MTDSQLLATLRGDLSGQTEDSLSIALAELLITSDSSKIEFVGSKVTGHHNGSFGKFSGAIDFMGQPEKSRVSVTIDMRDCVKTRNVVSAWREKVSTGSDSDRVETHTDSFVFFKMADFMVKAQLSVSQPTRSLSLPVLTFCGHAIVLALHT